jgi:hypothetical protein
MNPYILSKLAQRHVWTRIFNERLTEPLHLNALSLLVWMLGTYRSKINHDLVIRQNHAYSILKAADNAQILGLKTVTLIEFGVAAGAGLLNMAKIARDVTKVTGIEFKIYGFDTGVGMPAAADYRDHPDLYQQGDFPMNFEALRNVLPENVRLVIGDVAQTVPDFLNQLSETEPVGYVAVDVDYYSSARAALKVFTDAKAGKYLPITLVYMDDVALEPHNSYCGELLAIQEFNVENQYRKLERHAFLENTRIYRKSAWIKHIFFLHVLDHPTRFIPAVKAKKRTIANPYVSFAGNREDCQVQ